MEDLKKILDLFGLEFHNCKFAGKDLPKLALVVNPRIKGNSVSNVNSVFQSLPAVAFKVSVINGREYCEIAIPDISESDKTDQFGWDNFDAKDYCGYNYKNKTVYIGYPYPNENNLPLERAIIHELGHYKQDVLFNAHFINDDNDNNIILEYHNIMINENRLCNNEIENSMYWWEGYRVGYGTIKNHKDNRNASTILIKLLDKDFSKEKKLLLNKMLEIAKVVETNDNVDYNKDVISKLVRNMNSQLKEKV